MAALVIGSTMRAIRAEKIAAMPAGIAVGTTTIGHHIILLPSWPCRGTGRSRPRSPPPRTRSPRTGIARTGRSARRPAPFRPPNRRSKVGARVSRRVLATRKVLLHLLFHTLLDDPPGVLVAVHDRPGQRLDLAERRVRRDRRHVRVTDDVEHAGTVR